MDDSTQNEASSRDKAANFPLGNGETPQGQGIEDTDRGSSSDAAEVGEEEAGYGGAEENFILFDLDAGSASFVMNSAPAWPGPVLPDLEILGIQAGLVLTDKQRQHVGLLNKMLEAEEKPAPKARQRRDSSASFRSFLIRFGTASILLLVIIFTIIRNEYGRPVMPAPAETSQALAWIEKLSGEDAVLVVFDYQPGFSFEMESAAAPIIERISRRAAQVITVSTLPLGSVLAEQYFASSDRKLGSDDQTRVTHLGFLPGGTLGIARLPKALAAMDDDSRTDWENASPVSQGVSIFPNFPRIDSLRMIVIITEDAQKGRDWIEQMQAQQMDIPIIFVASAQAAPIIRPYLSLGERTTGISQVVGMVAGLEGSQGAADRSPTHAPLYNEWNAYEMGVLAAAASMLAALVAGLLNRQRLKRIHHSPKRSSQP